MIVAGPAAVAPDNFVPLFPTPTLRDAPIRSLGAATVAALVGFAGVVVLAVAVDYRAERDVHRSPPRRRVGRVGKRNRETPRR